MTDSIANFLTRIRNAVHARHRVVETPASNITKEITKILKDQGWILNYKFSDDNKQGRIKIALKYDYKTNKPAIQKLIRISKPGLRQYRDVKNLPRVLNGLGVAIISTSHGLITDKEARKKNIGGEIICYVY